MIFIIQVDRKRYMYFLQEKVLGNSGSGGGKITTINLGF